MYYTYILYSENYDRYYIGSTGDLAARLEKHNSAEVKSTKAYLPWELKYFEVFKSRSEAMRREKFLKQQRNKIFYTKLIRSQLAESRGLGITH
jgi:putative endonuclease